jgi:hypothetical protein
VATPVAIVRSTASRFGAVHGAARTRVSVWAVYAAVLALVGLLTSAGSARAAGVPARPMVLAVWGLIDGNNPLSRADVRVYAGAPRGVNLSGPGLTGRPLSESDGASARETAATGVALLAFRRLPREFTVVVAGGRAGGRAVPGALGAVIRGYRSGTVVYVNPVTTLIAGEVATSPDRSRASTLGVAQRRVYRLLGIPGWEDDPDLSYSDRYFDGASYLAAARFAGGIAALDQALVREARRGGQAHRFLQSGQIRQPAFAASGPRASVAVVGVGALISAAFKSLASWAGSSLARAVGEKAGNKVLGWLLAAFGLDDKLPDPTVLEVKKLVEDLGKQVTQLQGEVALAGFSTLLHQTDTTTGKIKHAVNQVALLANMPAKDPTKRAFTQTIIDYIGANLIDAPEILDQHLGSNVALADNLLKSASRTLGKHRFFGPADSAEVRSIYDYFASYQVQLAMLLQEYFHAKPTIYSPANATANLERLRGNVEGQAGSLKADVPANTVIETKPREMWITDPSGAFPVEVDLNYLASIRYYVSAGARKESPHFETRPAMSATSLGGLPFKNWGVPKKAAFERLTADSSGSSVIDWLQKDAGFSKQFLETSGGNKWMGDGFNLQSSAHGNHGYLRTIFFNFGSRTTSERLIEFDSEGPPRWQDAFRAHKSGLMYVRKLGADESYWWSG